MNKLLIVFLAICLIGCAHAFVKREATEDKAASDPLKQLEAIYNSLNATITKGLKEVGDKINTEEITKKLKEVGDKINTEDIKKKLEEGLETLKTSLDSLNAKTTEAPKS